MILTNTSTYNTELHAFDEELTIVVNNGSKMTSRRHLQLHFRFFEMSSVILESCDTVIKL